MKHARVTAHIKKAIQLPMRIGQFGDDIAGNRRALAHRFNLILQSAELLPLRRLDKALEAAEHARQAPIGEAVLNAMRVHDPFAPIVAGLNHQGSWPAGSFSSSGSGSPQLPNSEHTSGSSPFAPHRSATRTAIRRGRPIY